MLATVSQITVNDFLRDPDLPALLAEYAAESGMPGLPPPQIHDESYLMLERSGAYTMYAARLDGIMIGFCGVLVQLLPHYSQRMAMCESLFVAKQHRPTGAGVKLIRAAEQHARDHGSPAILMSAPAYGDLASLLPRMEYAHTSEVFCKCLI